jgi:hypothetical protein
MHEKRAAGNAEKITSGTEGFTTLEQGRHFAGKRLKESDAIARQARSLHSLRVSTCEGASP